MLGSQAPPEAHVSQNSSSIENLDQDVASIIARYIKCWSAEVQGSEAEREKARLERDSTFRALALSCKQGKILWHSYLLENITASVLDIVSVYHLLEGDSDLNLTKSLHFIPIRPGQIHPQTKKMARLRVIKLLPPFKDLGLDSDAQYHYDLWQITQRLYGKLVNLQTLIIQDPRLNFTFTRVVNGKLVPYTFLTNSLTKLYIGLRPEEDQHLSLNASNVVWLSLFCPHLRQLAVGFSIDLQDFHYLSDYAETFDGLSRVKEVAFQVFFKYTPDPKTWWGTPREANRGWKGDNKKTQAVYNILRAYRSLNSFEIFSSFQSRNPGDSSSIHSSCLLGLHNSFQSLQVLRLFGVGSDIQKPDSWNYSMFHNLKELSTEGNSIIPFHQFVQIKIPESLEIITLAYYSLFFKGIGDHKVGEEAFLAKFLKLHSLPKLKEVRVPAKLIDGTGLPRIEKEDRDAWIRKRKILKNLDIIKSGKVKLVEWKDGKPVNETFARTNPISCFLWLSS